MPIKKLSSDVQSLLRASCQISTFKNAVEELIYNSLDAISTSIAVRVNVPEGIIQVIDNGCGIRHSDIRFIGQRHMTSHHTDLASLKAVPNKYGFRGESLANIIAVSKIVNITSRFRETERAWIKTFVNGKEQKIAIATRPSRGTTVEVKGFLYNLNIQKKTIIPAHELQDIRIFLEQMSLIHSYISLSLRDDARNEIIFKIHKKRDIYQTLSALYNIERNSVQELTVEKHDYKVTGYIGKNKCMEKHWIYLNGKFVPSSSKLYKIVNNNLSKSMNNQNKPKAKRKIVHNDDENYLFTYQSPFYIIFISCPYLDYDFTQSMLEFNNWNRIKGILVKLVQFYTGDINLEPINNLGNKNNTLKETDMRDQIKEIIRKVMKKKSDKPCVSNIRNGIKGKLIKRKNLRKLPKLTASKIITSPADKESIKVMNTQSDTESQSCEKKEERNSNVLNTNSIKIIEKNLDHLNIKNKQYKKQYSSTLLEDNETRIKNKQKNIKIPDKIYQNQKYIDTKITKKNEDKFINEKTRKNFNDDKIEMSTKSVKQRCALIEKEADLGLNELHENNCDIFRNKIIDSKSVPKENINSSVCKKVNEIIIHDYYPKISKDINEHTWKIPKNLPYKTTYDLVKTVLNSQVVNFQQKWTVCKSKSPKDSICSPIRDTNNSYLHCNTPLEAYRYPRKISPKSKKLESNNTHEFFFSDISQHFSSKIPRLTYESHCYQRYDKTCEKCSSHQKLNSKYRFITNNSKNNFIFNENYSKKLHSRKIKEPMDTLRKHVLNKNTMLSNLRHARHTISSYTIEFSDTEDISNNRLDTNVNISKDSIETKSSFFYLTNDLTYTRPNITKTVNMSIRKTYEIIEDTNKTVKNYEDMYYKDKNKDCIYDTRLRSDSFSIGAPTPKVNNNDKLRMLSSNNIVFISNSPDAKENVNVSKNNLEEIHVNPIDVCETVLSNVDLNSKLNESFSFKKFDDTLFNFELDNLQNVENDFKKNNEKGKLELATNTGITFNHEENSLFKINEDRAENGQNMNSVFELRDRLRFLPKGMSQIFENCNTKTACNYNLEEDYFNNSIYDNYVNDVQINSEIYDPVVQNVTTTRRHTETPYIKLISDHVSLKFDSQHIKNTKILGQVDGKFIAGILEGHCAQINKKKEYLVLFDQHAVHERIRLEKNLSDYMSNNQWTSAALEEFSLVLSRDEMISLHNQREKFEQLGLQWTVVDDNKIEINHIPLAIISKTPRQIDKITEAVKNLITEEVNIIKMQKGCISLHPKSIMDLVFSEACRYAIKFGDHLSKDKCEELLSNLAKCKTPFQCAHGRPVMAVLMEYSNLVPDYMINLNNLKKIRKWMK